MKKYRIYILLVIFSSLFFMSNALQSQEIRQNIRGSVTDVLTGEILPGALVRLIDQSEAVVSDEQGQYVISVPLGYHQLEVSFLGFQSRIYNELLVTAGKEVVFNIQLERSSIALDDASVSARALPVSLASRTISAEQVQRYAATFYDPVRLSVSLPAVSSTNDQNNNVSVRGTSPAWNQWRLEGLEIASPNHLTNAGTFTDRPSQNGGGVNILSAQMLSDSRVLYGGYNATRGNALGAIFDMNLRNGNNSKSYHTLQASLLGLDLSTEGPFSENSKASYLVNYRYSFTGILAAAGVDFGGEEIKFQDLSFSLNFPNKNGETKVFGVGGISSNDFTGVIEFDEAEEEKDLSDIEYNGKMLAFGVKNIHRFNSKWSLGNTLIYSLNHSERNENVNFVGSIEAFDFQREGYDEDKISFRSDINYAFGKNAYLTAGYNAVKYNYRLSSLAGSGIIPSPVAPLEIDQGEWLVQPFVNYKGFIGRNFKIEGGINLSSFQQSNEFIIEPRLYIERYIGNSGSSIYARAGVYSQVQSYITRYSYILAGRNPSSSTNPDLALNKARKFQLGFLTKIGDCNINVEAFYDHYYDIPYYRGRDNSLFGALRGFSAFNLDNEFVLVDFTSKQDATVSGLDVSLEKQLTGKWYYLLGLTYYNSSFETVFDERFDSRWNGEYALNATTGKEIQLRPKNDKQRSLSMNARLIYQGGFRREALNIPISNNVGFDVFQTRMPFSNRNPDYFRIDLRFAWRVQKKDYTRTLSFDIQNATNYENFASESYDSVIGSVQNNYQLGIIPLLTYRVEF